MYWFDDILSDLGSVKGYPRKGSKCPTVSEHSPYYPDSAEMPSGDSAYPLQLPFPVCIQKQADLHRGPTTRIGLSPRFRLLGSGYCRTRTPDPADYTPRLLLSLANMIGCQACAISAM
jgi:hypothetical protein